MGNIFITSDLHFAHNRSFLYEPRGFTSIEEHDEKIIENWNATVRPQDTVYMLGDLMLNDNQKGIECLNKLNGVKYLIRGNHDSEARLMMYLCNEIKTTSGPHGYQWADVLRDGKWQFYLSHYPVCFSDYRGAQNSRKFALCGHSHTKNKWEHIQFCCYHVELDCHDNTPVSLDEIKADLNWFKVLPLDQKEKIINDGK
jgi:calcineurin-like phosphoesterase family protein